MGLVPRDRSIYWLCDVYIAGISISFCVGRVFGSVAVVWEMLSAASFLWSFRVLTFADQ